MTSTQAITVVKNALKTDTYTNQRVLDGIIMALSVFLRETRCVTGEGTITTTSGTATVNPADTISDFRPERLLQAEIASTYEPVVYVKYATLQQRIKNTNQTGKPDRIAFRSTTTGVLWPIPNDAYSIRLVYTKPLNSLTVAGDETINVPDEYLREALWFGATAAVEHNSPEALYQSVAWQRFRDQVIPDIRSACTIGGVYDPDINETN